MNWSLVPQNQAGPTSLPPGTTDAFRGHFRRVAAEALREASAATPRPSARPAPAPATASESRAFTQACTACRGWCCRGGGDHAFLDAASLRRILRQEGLEPGELEKEYLSRVKPTHLEDGCLFQGPQGCRLPRTLRSDTCNDWLCEDLRATRADWHENGGPPANQHFVPITRRRPGQPSSP